ncbi:MAG: hypothetical protein PHY12_13160 [Eubacteriales bacterium]|nr:hypothetical protein [Eubacteriales bacterium]
MKKFKSSSSSGKPKHQQVTMTKSMKAAEAAHKESKKLAEEKNKRAW